MTTKFFLSTIFCSILVSYVSSMLSEHKIGAMTGAANYITGFMTTSWKDPVASFSWVMSPHVEITCQGTKVTREDFLNEVKNYRYARIVTEYEPTHEFAEDRFIVRWNHGQKVLSFTVNYEYGKNEYKIIEIEIPGLWKNIHL
uniref:Hesp-376 n=1 Tax=Melampsora lini TaxID=5261 RepID=Q2MV39_MELLI|nr:hesp-376 [Melampsora lini]